MMSSTQDASRGAPTKSAASSCRPLVLIVEDRPAERAGLAALVEGEGFRVEVAAALAEARQQLDRESPTLVICDHVLPDGRGSEFVRSLQSVGEIDALLVSASLDRGELEVHGISDQRFLEKPIDVAKLSRVLNQHRPAGSD